MVVDEQDEQLVEASGASGSERARNSGDGSASDDEVTEVEDMSQYEPVHEREEIDDPVELPPKRPFCSLSTMARHLSEGLKHERHQALLYKVVSCHSSHGSMPELKDRWRSCV